MQHRAIPRAPSRLFRNPACQKRWKNAKTLSEVRWWATFVLMSLSLERPERSCVCMICCAISALSENWIRLDPELALNEVLRLLPEGGPVLNGIAFVPHAFESRV